MAPLIRLLRPQQCTAWDDYVITTPEGTFFHRAAWRDIITAAFRHRTHYVFPGQDGVLSGVLPLVHMRSLLFGNRLVSLPFCVYGGPLANDPASAQALTDHAIDLAKRLRADVIEFRMREPFALDWASRSDLYATFRRPITAEPEQNLKDIPRKQRAVVRKAFENRLHWNIGRDVGSFYRIYSESVRNLGTPVFSRRYFRLIADHFPDCSEVLTFFDDDEPLSAVLSFFFRDEVLPYYGGGGPRARQRGAFDFMYWQVMNQAATERGVRLFDFGRSKFGTGSFAFKKNWGFAPQPLNYQYWLRPGQTIAHHTPLTQKYRLITEVWKSLRLPVANLLGPPIVRGIG